ncbi:hypothetical protein Q9966_015367 [Columba livia]|nr:hypothetical protein Q9966_015367 [Columba livia]
MEGARSPALVHVDFPEVPSALLANLNRQREEGTLCDVSIHVQGRVFRAHRAVLAASSPFFHDQVLLKNMTTIVLPGAMDPGAFETVLGSAYTGRLSMAPEDIVNLLTVNFCESSEDLAAPYEALEEPGALAAPRALLPVDMQGNPLLLFPAAGAAQHGAVPLAGAAADGNKIFMCHCGKAFSHKSMRDRHVNMHLNLRPFGCPVCAKKFKMKHHLTEHMKTHTGLKPYACDACAKRFMARHIWTIGFCDPGGCGQMLGPSTSGHPITSHLDCWDL